MKKPTINTAPRFNFKPIFAKKERKQIKQAYRMLERTTLSSKQISLSPKILVNKVLVNFIVLLFKIPNLIDRYCLI
jgi:hypothetical protein